jgi:hypothetical protein
LNGNLLFAKLALMRATPFALIVLLAACAGPIETRIESAGSSVAKLTSFSKDPDATGLVARGQTAVTKALTDKGYRLAEVAELTLQVTVSDRPANISLQNGSKTLASAANKRRCAKREYRVGVTLTEQSNGNEYYRGTAAEFHCQITVEQALGPLVQAALADIGAPRGSYTVKRPRPRSPQSIPEE